MLLKQPVSLTFSRQELVPNHGWRKEIEWGYMPPLYKYRLNWVRKTSWGWWDERDDTALQTQDSKFGHATSRSQRFLAILNHEEWVGKKHFFWNLKARVRFKRAISDCPSRQLKPLHHGPRPWMVGVMNWGINPQFTCYLANGSLKLPCCHNQNVLPCVRCVGGKLWVSRTLEKKRRPSFIICSSTPW